MTAAPAVQCRAGAGLCQRACKHLNSQSPSHPILLTPATQSLAYIHDMTSSHGAGTQPPVSVDAVGVRDVFPQMKEHSS